MNLNATTSSSAHVGVRGHPHMASGVPGTVSFCIGPGQSGLGSTLSHKGFIGLVAGSRVDPGDVSPFSDSFFDSCVGVAWDASNLFALARMSVNDTSTGFSPSVPLADAYGDQMLYVTIRLLRNNLAEVRACLFDVTTGEAPLVGIVGELPINAGEQFFPCVHVSAGGSVTTIDLEVFYISSQADEPLPYDNYDP